MSDPTRRTWSALLLGFGVAALGCYFASFLDVFPWSVGRFLFYGFGITLTLSAFAAFRLLCAGGRRPWIEIGLLMTGIAGFAVHSMAVIQDVIWTSANQRFAAVEEEGAREMIRRALQATNDVQLALDIVFDLWISLAVVALGIGALVHLGHRALGGLGLLAAVLALGVNLRTLPTPPADAGLFDPGPFVATWMGFFLVVAWRGARRSTP